MQRGQAETGAGAKKRCARCLATKPLGEFADRFASSTQKDFCRLCERDLATLWAEREKRVGPNVHRRRKARSSG